MAKKITESKKPAEKPVPSSAAKTPETKSLAVTNGNTQVAKRSSGKLAGRGFENIEKSDLLLPRLKLLQPMSPEVAELGQKPGTIYLPLGNKSYGTKIEVTPVLHFRSRIKFIPRDDGGGIDCSSPDSRIPRDTTKYAATCAACPEALWNDNAKNKKDKQPRCSMSDNFLCLVGDSTEPVLVTFDRSKLKTSKKWYSLGGLKSGSDMWDWVYELSVVPEKNEQGDNYFNYSIKDLSKPSPDKRKAVCLSLWESLVGKTIDEKNTDAEGQESTAGASAAGTGSGSY